MPSSIEVVEHAIYLSTIKIEVQEEVVQITIKVFEDDLRDAMRAHHGFVIDTSSATFVEEVQEYFTNHLSIGSDMSIATRSVSLVGDSYVITAFGIQQIESFIRIEADYFMELFPTQQNILHFIHGEVIKYHIFKKGKEAIEISF